MQQPEADARAWGGARSAESNHHVPACRLNPSNLADAAPNATGPSSKTCLCDNTAKPAPHAPARDTDRAVGTPVRGAPRPRRKVVIAATAVPRIPRLRAPLPTVRPASDGPTPRQFWNEHALWPIPPQTKAELPSSLLEYRLKSSVWRVLIILHCIDAEAWRRCRWSKQGPRKAEEVAGRRPS